MDWAPAALGPVVVFALAAFAGLMGALRGGILVADVTAAVWPLVPGAGAGVGVGGVGGCGRVGGFCCCCCCRARALVCGCVGFCGLLGRTSMMLAWPVRRRGGMPGGRWMPARGTGSAMWVLLLLKLIKPLRVMGRMGVGLGVGLVLVPGCGLVVWLGSVG